MSIELDNVAYAITKCRGLVDLLMDSGMGDNFTCDHKHIRATIFTLEGLLQDAEKALFPPMLKSDDHKQERDVYVATAKRMQQYASDSIGSDFYGARAYDFALAVDCMKQNRVPNQLTQMLTLNTELIQNQVEPAGEVRL